MVRWLKIILITILFLYGIICVGLYSFQEKILFHPEVLTEDFRFRLGQELEIEVADDLNIHCLKFQNQPSKGAILYFHGNKGSNRRCTSQSQMFAQNGYDIYMADYRGYGKSDGTIRSQEDLYHDAQAVYNHIKQFHPESKIVLIGYSIGTGIASYLAAHNNPQQLILISPYQSIVDLKNRIFRWIPNVLIKYELDNETHLRHSSCPITLFHGTADRVIPYDSSLSLLAQNPDRTNLHTLNGTSHRRSIFHDVVENTVREILEP